MIERTFVMIKPDGVSRRLCGTIIGRYEAKGLKLIGLKMRMMSRSLAEAQYAAHEGQSYYEPLVEFMISGPTVMMVWEGESAVSVIRRLNGDTNSLDAPIGSVRGDFGLTVRKNLVHASDSSATAEREIALHFRDEELVSYSMPDEHWLRL